MHPRLSTPITAPRWAPAATNMTLGVKIMPYGLVRRMVLPSPREPNRLR